MNDKKYKIDYQRKVKDLKEKEEILNNMQRDIY